MTKFRTNLRILKRSRKQPKAGELFVFRPKGRDYYFGLVVKCPLKHISVDGSIADEDWDGALAYLYNSHSPRKTLIPNLNKNDLLMPPVVLDLYCWRLGYLETVATIELNEDVLLSRHCFRRASTEKYFDENGKRLRKRSEPCGIYGLTPFRGLDDKVSRSLGIPLAD